MSEDKTGKSKNKTKNFQKKNPMYKGKKIKNRSGTDSDDDQ